MFKARVSKKRKARSLSRSYDTKWLGEEVDILPASPWNGETDYDVVSNWYNYFYKTDEMWNWVVSWAKKSKKFTNQQIKNIELTPEKTRKLAFIVRVNSKGVDISKCCLDYLENSLQVIASGEQRKTGVSTTSSNKTPTIHILSVAEKLKQKTSRMVEELEQILDDVDNKTNIKELFQKNSLKNKSLNDIQNYYNEILDEYKEVSGNSTVGCKSADEKKQLITSYRFVSKKEINATKNILNNIVEACEFLANNNNILSVIRMNKNAKPKSNKKDRGIDVSNLKYREAFDDKDGIKLVSLPPTKVINKKAVLLYDVTQKSFYYIEAEKGETITVKGTTFQGINKNKSFFAHVRKPKEVLKNISTSNAKTKILKLIFEDGKNVKSTPTKRQLKTDRCNKNKIILKVFS